MVLKLCLHALRKVFGHKLAVSTTVALEHCRGACSTILTADLDVIMAAMHHCLGRGESWSVGCHRTRRWVRVLVLGHLLLRHLHLVVLLGLRQ